MLDRLTRSACLAATLLLSACGGVAPPSAATDAAVDGRAVSEVCGMNVGLNAEESCGPPPASSTSGAIRCEGDTFRCRVSGPSGCDCEDVRCPLTLTRGESCDAAVAGLACGAGFEREALVCRAVGDAYQWRYHAQDVPTCDEIWFTRSAGVGVLPWLCPEPEVIEDAGLCCYLPARYMSVPAPSCPGADGRSYECDFDGVWQVAP